MSVIVHGKYSKLHEILNPVIDIEWLLKTLHWMEFILLHLYKNILGGIKQNYYAEANFHFSNYPKLGEGSQKSEIVGSVCFEIIIAWKT